MSPSKVSSQLLHVDQLDVLHTWSAWKNKCDTTTQRRLCVLPESASVDTPGAGPETWHGTIASRVHGWRPHAIVVISHAALVILESVVTLAISHLQCWPQGPHSAHLGLCCIRVKLLTTWGPVARVQSPVAINWPGGKMIRDKVIRSYLYAVPDLVFSAIRDLTVAAHLVKQFLFRHTDVTHYTDKAEEDSWKPNTAVCLFYL